MLFTVKSTESCCALWELSGISTFPDPESTFRAVMKYFFDGLTTTIQASSAEFQLAHPVANYETMSLVARHYGKPFVMFSGTAEVIHPNIHTNRRGENYGQQLADWIEAEKLGKVIVTNKAKNWTQNVVQLWLWETDWPAMWKWIEDHPLVIKETANVTTEG